MAVGVEWLGAFLSSTVQAGTVLLLAALGETYAERSGILNLGVEGMMIVGAAFSYLITLATGDDLLAILVAMGMATLLALIHAVISISFRLNQIVSGLAITLFGLGLSGYLTFPDVRVGILRAINPSLPMSMAYRQSTPKLPDISIPLLSQIPVIGPAFFRQNAIIYASYILTVLLWWFLFKTRPGLNIRSVGENPAMADSLGINVYLIRYVATLLGGALAGLAGAFLFIGYQPFWVEGMTAGRGFVALALVIFAAWSPLRVMAGAYLFGGVEALQFRLQVLGYGTTAPQFLLMLPYVTTIIVLVALSYEMIRKKIGVPAALAIPYAREE